MTLSIHSSDCLFHSLSQRIKEKLGLKLLFCVCNISSLISDLFHHCNFTVGNYKGWYISYVFKSIAEYTKAEQYALILVDRQDNRTNIKHCTDLESSKRKKKKKLT